MLDKINQFNPGNYTSNNWFVAMHEAAHYVAAIIYGYHVFGVELAVTNRRNGILGQVKISDKSKLSDLVVTLVGPVMDSELLSQQELKDDLGFLYEVERVAKETHNALGDYYHEIYIGHTLPTRDELYDAYDDISHRAHTIVTEYQAIIETVAKAFLLTRNKSTGRIAHSKLKKIRQMTKVLIDQHLQ
jgi:hypothetical protein